MKKIFLLLGLCNCANVSIPENTKELDVDNQITVKTVRDYVESNEFIDIIPEQHYQELQTTRSVKNKDAKDYQMKAAIYRFYKSCTMNDDGIIQCGISSGKEIKISIIC